MGYLRAILGGVVVGGIVLKKILYADSENNGKQRTEKYLCHLYRDISLLHSKKWNKEEVNDIKKAVRNMMKKILIEAYSKEKLSEKQIEKLLIPVGSMEEETKFMHPDEFDFSFVIPDQDVGAKQFAEDNTTEDLDFDTFFMKAGANFVHFPKENPITDKPYFLGNFSQRIIKSCESLIEKKDNVIKGDTGTFTLLEGKKTLPEGNDNGNILDKNVKKANISQQGVALHFEKRFIWTNHVTKEGLYVSVDLAPVVKPQHPLPETACFLGREVGYFVVPFKTTLMLKRRMYMITGEAKTDCKNELLNMAYVKTLVEDENKRVKEMWSKYRPWLVCYVLMKYFTHVEKKYDIYIFEPTENGLITHLQNVTIQIPERQTHFSSYNWKTMILRKVYEDKEHHDSVWECFNSLTEPLLAPNKIKIPYLWDPFIEEIICLKYVNDNDEQQTPIPTGQVRILKEIRQILEEVSNDEKITYVDFMKKVGDLKKELEKDVPK